jgi:flavin reductase (DIM6/NTAB) family NADH-FMN oxidoreductase RutF
MHLECVLSHTLEVGLHTMFIGEIKDVLVDESCLDKDGRPDPALVDPVSYAPETRGYYAMGELLGQAFSLGRSVLPPKSGGK